MATIYPAQANSPQTSLKNAITAAATTLTLADASLLPAPPNLAVIGVNDECETIRYSGRTGNQLTGVTRGLEGTARAWPAGTVIARNFTAWDFNNLAENLTGKVSPDDITRLVPLHTMERSDDPTDCWKVSPGLHIPDGGPVIGMTIRAVWAEEWDASVPMWCLGDLVPLEPAGIYPAGTYLLSLIYSGGRMSWHIQGADKADKTDITTVIPSVVLDCDYGGDFRYEVMSDERHILLTGEKGAAIRVTGFRGVGDTWRANDYNGPVTSMSQTYYKLDTYINGKWVLCPIRPGGTYPTDGVYLLVFDGEAWQIQDTLERFGGTVNGPLEVGGTLTQQGAPVAVEDAVAPALTGTASGTSLRLVDAAAGTRLRSLRFTGKLTETVEGEKGPDNPSTLTGVKPAAVQAGDSTFPLPLTAPLYNMPLGPAYKFEDSFDAVSGVLTRRLGVKTFTGKENDVYYYNNEQANSETKKSFYYVLPGGLRGKIEGRCTHFRWRHEAPPICEPGEYGSAKGGPLAMYFTLSTETIGAAAGDTPSQLESKVKAWLAAQAAAGTPVMIVYVLAEPVTEQLPGTAVLLPASECTITAGGAAMTAEYVRDTNAVMERMVAPALTGTASGTALHLTDAAAGT
ncbi:MAG: hypothetical protein HFJ80_04330, partial [Clostridiales bacterium]|nr:hypothetical protein [Clostridiales bacterium]